MYQSGEDLCGKTIVDADRDKIGKVKDYYMGASQGISGSDVGTTGVASGSMFLLVDTGMFGLGILGDKVLIPAENVQVLDDDSVMVPYSKDFVKNAPQVDTDEGLLFEDEQRVREYYYGGLGQYRAA
jgi:hypothetical protein